jgi:hypothetical protein
MESFKHQEWRGRQQVSWSAIWLTALVAGGITYIMSGGSPWSTAGTMNAIVGRDVPWNFFLILIGHFAASAIYSMIIALAIYRLPLIASLVVGAFVSLVLCFLSKEVFNTMGWVMQSPEIRAVLTHLAFGLFASAAYKAAAVPPPAESDADARIDWHPRNTYIDRQS